MAKKHKKKVYNTPKKVKHTHQNIGINKFINSFIDFKSSSFSSCQVTTDSLSDDNKLKMS